MKKQLITAAAASALIWLNGCQVAAPALPPAESGTTGASGVEAEIARIRELRARGVISEAQAQEIIQVLDTKEGGDSPARPKSEDELVAVSATPPAVAVEAVAAVASMETTRAAYQPTVVLEGRLRSIGSDTMDLLVASWEREFARHHPKLRILHEGRGTSTATPALLENQADIGPMSRPMLEAEAERFRARFGYEATQVRTALDALGVYVHPENPIARRGLSLAELDAIFSAARKRGGAERLVTWGSLGLDAEWANAPIRVYGRNRASGTYGFFRDTALLKGEFGAWVEEQASSALLVTKIEADKFGIGFSGVGYKTDGVALVPLARETGEAAVAPSEASALAGSYALARPLYLATNRDPARPMSDLQREFLTFVLSADGQDVVRKEGYYPLPEAVVAEERAKLSP
jgi:phosphate transport system substrate-binding protein